jgi:hypothetical protein
MTAGVQAEHAPRSSRDERCCRPCHRSAGSPFDADDAKEIVGLEYPYGWESQSERREGRWPIYDEEITFSVLRTAFTQ